MLFNSLSFCLFMPTVFLLYWLVFKRVRSQNIFLLVASYFFYACWSSKFTLLIIFTTLCSWLSALCVERWKCSRRRQRWALWSNIVVNLGILFTFKYYDFFGEQLSALFRVFGIQLDWVTLGLVLPVGISFYTFQAIAYCVDVYRGQIPACRNIITFASFMSFFPQLVAGPIERASSLLRQFELPRVFSRPQVVEGLKTILWGLFKKLVIADNCAPFVTAVFDNYTGYNSTDLIYAMVLFTFQIYGDFSGYSDIALGCGKLLGFELTRNFNYPYFSRNIPEFWRRWHITLNLWFRDYVYFPLGGSRCSKWKRLRNTFTVFLLSGLWHGASLTFVSWGMFHACLFVPRIIKGKKRDKNESPHPEAKGFVANVKLQWAIWSTFFLVALSRVFYRANSLPDAFAYIRRMFTCFQPPYIPTGGRTVGLYILVFILVEWFNRRHPHPFHFSGNQVLFSNEWVRLALYSVLFVFILLAAGGGQTFIYFQF